jgi:hypothetical protein
MLKKSKYLGAATGPPEGAEEVVSGFKIGLWKVFCFSMGFKMERSAPK